MLKLQVWYLIQYSGDYNHIEFKRNYLFLIVRSKTEFCNNSSIYRFIGESNVVWTHNDETNKESVVFAGDIKIRKDLRIKLIDGTSLYIKEATRAYAGNTLYFSNQGNIIYSDNFPGTKMIFKFICR